MWLLLVDRSRASKGGQSVNRTRGFVNLNRFKSGKAIKKLYKTVHDSRKTVQEKRRGGEK